MNYTFQRWSTELRTMTVFSHSVNSSDSAVNMWVCSMKAVLTWWLSPQGHKNEMDTVVSFVPFHLLMRFCFSWTVKVSRTLRALSRSKSLCCWIKNKHFLSHTNISFWEKPDSNFKQWISQLILFPHTYRINNWWSIFYDFILSFWSITQAFKKKVNSASLLFLV